MSAVELRFLGEFAVLRDGEVMPLPPSRKTRALLAYLSLNDRRHSRESLCELLWDIPDDPRGSLRWSLSKLRRLLDDEDKRRIIADRNSVQVKSDELAIDVAALYELAEQDLTEVATGKLEEAAGRYAGIFLEGLEFSSFHDFHAWCIAERERATRAQATVLRELVDRLSDSPERAAQYARSLVGLVPYDEAARATLIRLLVSSRHMDEAEQQYELGMRMLREAGITSSGALLRARRPAANEPARPAPATERPPAGVLRAPASSDSLIGRDEETRYLQATISRVIAAGQAEVVLVRGEPGIGKSRLLRFVARLARDSNSYLLQAGAFESEAIRPFALWIDALRATQNEALVRIFGDRNTENRDRLFSDLCELLAHEADTRSVVLIFDDLQWADESSLAALHYAARMNRQRAMLAVVAARDGEIRDNVPLQQALRGLRNDGLLHEVKLGPLAANALAKLIEQTAPGSDSERLSRECGGNPLLAIELARAESEGSGSGSLDQLVRDRVARFDVDEVEVLQWAAVLSPRIDAPTLVALTGLASGTVGATLGNAERQSILTSTSRGLRFSHELVARAIYTNISPVRRQLMHRRIAEMLEENAALDQSRAADLAHHATQSGDAGLGARAMVSAGRLCLRFFANDEALSLARRGLQLAKRLAGAERVCVSIDLHDVILAASPLEDWDKAAREYVQLAEQALDYGAVAHARLGYNMAAYVRWAHGDWADAREQSLQSERVVRGGSDAEQIIGMADTAKCLALLERDLGQADAMLMEADALARRRRISHRSIPAGLGMLRYHENRLDEAEELFEQARALCKAAGDRVNEFQANEYLFMVEYQRGRIEAARARSQELMLIGDKLRTGSEAPFAHTLYGLCKYELEDDSEPLDAALNDLRIADAKHRLAYVLTRAAFIDYERGRIGQAAARAEEALRYATLLELPTEMLLAHTVLGLSRKADDDDEAARRHTNEVLKLQDLGVAEWAREAGVRLAGQAEE